MDIHNAKKCIVWESMHMDEPIKTISQEEKRQQFESEDDDDDDDDDESDKRLVKLLSTPFGYVSVDDSMNPLKQFVFWKGFTNFNVSTPVVKTIKEMPGVEVLMILTRYQFLIAIGKLFTPGDVMKEIQRTLCDETKEPSGQRDDIASDSGREEQPSIQAPQEEI